MIAKTEIPWLKWFKLYEWWKSNLVPPTPFKQANPSLHARQRQLFATPPAMPLQSCDAEAAFTEQSIESSTGRDEMPVGLNDAVAGRPLLHIVTTHVKARRPFSNK